MNDNYTKLAERNKHLRESHKYASTLHRNLKTGRCDFAHGLPSNSATSKLFVKITTGLKGEYGHINGRYLTDDELQLFKELVKRVTHRLATELEHTTGKINAIEKLLEEE